MDTPEGNQIGTPISKFEDSPVFNYINNLSPIKPVKSIDISGTFNSLSFASLPSVFTSPHLNSQKGPRFFRRHDLSDLPKPDFSSDDRTKGNGVSNVAQNSDCSAGMQDGFAHVNFIREDSVDLSNENSELPIELPQTLKYDSGSPDGKPIPIATHGNMSNPMLEITGTSAALDQFVQETSFEKHHSFDTEVELQRVFCHGQTKEERMGSDSENLISDAANLFIFDASKIEASKEQDQALAGHESGCFTSFVSELPQDRIDDLHPKESICNFSSSEKHENQDLTSEVVEIDDHSGKYHSKQRFASTFHIKQDFNDPSVKISEKLGNHIALGCKQGGLPRRCLVFEMAGTHKRNLVEDHNSHSSISFPSDGELGLDDKKLGHPKPGASSSTRMLPGIGLHLNALAVSTKDCKFMKHETLASGNQLVTIPSSVDSFHSLTSEQGPVNKSLDIDTIAAPDANEILVEEDDSQSAFGASEEFNHSNVKKKRRKLEHSEESGACKRCNCKKSKCLKLYCECFAAGLYCVEPCSCKECFNKPIHEDTVLATRKQIESRNSLAFAPKVIVSSEYGLEIGEESNKTPASARHKRGCNCKKSSCLKKYCECYQGGVGCSSNCRCESCKNTFGRKDGTEEEESESCEKFGEEEIPATDKAQNEEDKCSDHFLPTTPSLRLCRQSVQVLFSSRGKPPQSFVLSVESSPQLPTTSQIAKSDSFRLQPKFGKHFQIISEGETPDILRENCSPIRTLKIASPNRKRISPPHNEFMVSPGPRPTRKLVLQSIPSSLSLTHRERNLQ